MTRVVGLGPGSSAADQSLKFLSGVRSKSPAPFLSDWGAGNGTPATRWPGSEPFVV